jgi:hypothetical protein
MGSLAIGIIEFVDAIDELARSEAATICQFLNNFTDFSPPVMPSLAGREAPRMESGSAATADVALV